MDFYNIPLISKDNNNIQDSKSEVFIIESLKPNDNSNNLQEGLKLYHFLKSLNKNPQYIYFEDKNQLAYIAKEFRKSNYRYLHISMHGNASSLRIGSENVNFKEFADFFRGHLKLRRVFISACLAGNTDFRHSLCEADNQGMQSFLAPTKEIRFGEALAFWHIFYMALLNQSVMSARHETIRTILKHLQHLVASDFLLSTYNSVKNNWNDQTYESKLLG